jgi:hypothetical protein
MLCYVLLFSGQMQYNYFPKLNVSIIFSHFISLSLPNIVIPSIHFDELIIHLPVSLPDLVTMEQTNIIVCQ